MTKYTINTGTNANDGTGDDLRTAMIYINSNFTELYDSSTISSQITIAGNKINANATNADLVLEPAGTGAIVLPAITIDDNAITGTRSNENLVISASGTGHIVVGALRINGTTISSDDSSAINFAESNITLGSINISGNVITSTDSTTISFGGEILSGVGTPTQQSDVATKDYVDGASKNFGNLEIVTDTLQNVVTNNHLKLDTQGTGLIQVMSNAYLNSGDVTVASSAATAIDSFVAATYRGAKYVISISDSANTKYEIVEANVTHDGTSAFISTFGSVSNVTPGDDSTTLMLPTFSADINSGNVRVLALPPSSDSTTYKFFRTLIPV